MSEEHTKEEVVIRFLDVNEDGKPSDKSCMALYIEHEGIVKDILLLSNQENMSRLVFNPEQSI